MEKEEKSPSEPPRAVVLPEGLSVLIVDDDVILRKLFTRAIKRVAPTWTIQQAESGETALRRVVEVDDETVSTTCGRQDYYAIIFMDQYMPSVSAQVTLTGTETIHALRAKGVRSRICGLSANDLEGSFLEAGADSFMLKPIPSDKTAMERWLGTILGS